MPTVLERLPLRPRRPGVAAAARPARRSRCRARGPRRRRRARAALLRTGDGRGRPALRRLRARRRCAPGPATTARPPKSSCCAACCASTATTSTARWPTSTRALQRGPGERRRARLARGDLHGAGRLRGGAARMRSARAADASELQAAGCRAYVEATTGETRAAYASLRSALERAPQAGAGACGCGSLTRLAEMAWRAGRRRRGRAAFPRRAGARRRTTTSCSPPTPTSCSSSGRAARSRRRCCKDWARSDTLLLRLALAERALGLPRRGAARADAGRALRRRGAARRAAAPGRGSALPARAASGDARGGARRGARELEIAARAARRADPARSGARRARAGRRGAGAANGCERSGFEDARLRAPRGAACDEGWRSRSAARAGVRPPRWRTSRATATSRCSVEARALRGQWDIALRDLEYAIGLDADGDGAITWGELRAKHARDRAPTRWRA